MQPPFKKIALPNGLRLILAPRPASLASTMLVLVAAGSEYETKQNNGVSHFLEHLTFKGTVNRPKSNMISMELDALGAEYNAFTGTEYTGYWGKAENHKLPQVIELIADLYLNPIFEPQEIEKERGVVIEEINMSEDAPADSVHRLFYEVLYGDQPAGWKITGEKEIIRTIGREEIMAYRGTHYVAPTTIVVVAGSFNKKDVTAQIETLFSGLPRKRAILKPKTREAQRAPQFRTAHKEVAQTHLVLGTRAFSVNDKRRRAIKVLANILGGGMSSRLFRTLRDELGLAYYVGAYADLMIDHGNFAVAAGVDNARAPEAVAAILEEMRQLAQVLVPERELQKAKDHMIGGLIMDLETSDEIANYYGMQELLSRELTAPEEVIKKIHAVTREEVRAAARAIFKNAKLNLAAIGPHKGSAALAKVLRF